MGAGLAMSIVLMLCRHNWFALNTEKRVVKSCSIINKGAPLVDPTLTAMLRGNGRVVPGALLSLLSPFLPGAPGRIDRDRFDHAANILIVGRYVSPSIDS